MNVWIDGLDVTAVRRRLFTRWIGTHLYVFAAVPSTRNALRELARAGAHAGTVVMAETEAAGPPGGSHANLYASVLVRPAKMAVDRCVLSFVSALALADAMHALGAAPAVQAPDDVVIGPQRVATTHVDVVGTGDAEQILIGVSVNVNVDVAALPQGETSLREHLGRPIDRNALAGDYLNHLEKWLDRYRTQGAGSIVSAWDERDVHRLGAERTMTAQS